MRAPCIATFVATLSLGGLLLSAATARPGPEGGKTYLGFDANDYPGDDAMDVLRKTFSFTSYWIGPPPEEKKSSWLGRRALLKKQGFGFLVLWNGPNSRKLKSQVDAREKAASAAEAAAKVAREEGFPAGTAVFLDIEEGGRLSPAYHAYVNQWIDGLKKEAYRAGVYCSAMPVKEGDGVTITTAKDLQDQLAGRKLVFWVYNDACPPSPGCVFPKAPPEPSAGGVAGAAVWQFAQSPKRKEFTAQCAATYAADGNCYAPGDAAHKWFLDVNAADSPDPSAQK